MPALHQCKTPRAPAPRPGTACCRPPTRRACAPPGPRAAPAAGAAAAPSRTASTSGCRTWSRRARCAPSSRCLLGPASSPLACSQDLSAAAGWAVVTRASQHEPARHVSAPRPAQETGQCMPGCPFAHQPEELQLPLEEVRAKLMWALGGPPPAPPPQSAPASPARTGPASAAHATRAAPPHATQRAPCHLSAAALSAADAEAGGGAGASGGAACSSGGARGEWGLAAAKPASGDGAKAGSVASSSRASGAPAAGASASGGLTPRAGGPLSDTGSSAQASSSAPGRLARSPAAPKQRESRHAKHDALLAFVLGSRQRPFAIRPCRWAAPCWSRLPTELTALSKTAMHHPGGLTRV